MYQVLYRSEFTQIHCFYYDLRVVQSGDGGSVSGERKLGDEYWGSHAGEGETESDEESASNEHADVLSSGLNDCSDDDHCRISSLSC